MPSKPSQSAEDYLERFHELLESKGTAHVADIAQSLGVGQTSVTSMVQKLADERYLHYEKYRALTLTDAGRAVAEQIRDRHQVLAGFLRCSSWTPRRRHAISRESNTISVPTPLKHWPISQCFSSNTPKCWRSSRPPLQPNRLKPPRANDAGRLVRSPAHGGT